MTTRLIHTLCSELTKALGKKKEVAKPDAIYALSYTPGDLPRFITDLIGTARQYDLNLVKSYVDPKQLEDLLTRAHYPLLYFEQESDAIVPVIAGKNLRGEVLRLRIDPDGKALAGPLTSQQPVTDQDSADRSLHGKVLYFTAFPMESLVSNDQTTAQKKLTPFQRLMRLLGNEKKDIGYIYLYAIVVGLISLSLPLGIQAIINLIAGGMVFSSVYLLVGLVILGVLVTGIMQIIQITLVETLQQRVFAKAAFEFTYRIPRVRTESLLNYYPPELMNRFFDILTVQKSLPKILIEITGAALQIIFGIILLSFYHPFFIAFGLFIFLLVALIIYFNGPKGLETSLVESKYKYKVAQWLEDIARSLYSFKMAGNSNLPMDKMDGLVNKYLTYRKKHFSILVTFFWNAVGFKTAVIGGLLILGTVLVIDRQISLGQFVASEIVIVLLTSSVEKLILSIDVVFDSLTAVEKLGSVTDLPLERESGFNFKPENQRQGLNLQVSNLRYRYDSESRYVLDDLTFGLEAQRHLCITGTNGSGKNTLLKVLSGLLTSYEGGITYNGISLRDLNIASLRNYIEKNISNDDIFEGTILENITMGRKEITLTDLEWVLDQLQLSDQLSKFPEGLSTLMVPGGRRFSDSFITKVIIARCIIHKPRLLMITDLLQNLERPERVRLIRFLTDRQNPWSLLILSNDPLIMSICDEVMVLKGGSIVVKGTYEEVQENPEYKKSIQYEIQN
ncbi:ATP-binding cassette domain-containing protein [Rhabdobacter roseus]|uniref:ABC-type bacteriocin/lantibiotic exporter with double-glycine peptidase domain n=1 Tax=Rhabdobacter roseus TaxID=1655419 RepID=A0A840TJI4_9BACT|nr:ATP-binding cassette domain-containing protein [Rhabdobacter roseus]MBB5283571.1 ABC-type bacteriocin/lantibiotic exporter with double-glycine peptidase domain [Rhabdobacter roseus]